MLRTPLLVAVVVLTFASTLVAADLKTEHPFNGKNTDGWKLRHEGKTDWHAGHVALDPADPAKLKVTKLSEGEAPALVNVSNASSDLYTEQTFGDCTVEVEVMVPKGSNSGIYFMGEYEVQILDSYGKKDVGPGDMGGIYITAAPRKNVAKAPGEWQKFVIEFVAPKFDGDKKTANAKFRKVTLNGEVIHENVEVKGPTTSSLTGKESPRGPLMLQGDHGPVAFRNLKVTHNPQKAS